jgi:hypothetical protein
VKEMQSPVSINISRSSLPSGRISRHIIVVYVRSQMPEVGSQTQKVDLSDA